MGLENLNFKYDDKKQKFVCLVCGLAYKKLGPHINIHFKSHGDISIVEKVEQRKALQLKVLRRFMSDEEIKIMLEGYAQNSIRGFSNKKREVWLSTPISGLEKRLLYDYFFNLETTLRDIGKKHGIRTAAITGNKAWKVGIRILFQIKDDINLKEKLEKGGE
jgi:hypothetical protein